MGLLDKLQTAGSNLSAYDGKNPTQYDGVSQYQEDLAKSQLDLDGKQPLVYDRQSNYDPIPISQGLSSPISYVNPFIKPGCSYK